MWGRVHDRMSSKSADPGNREGAMVMVMLSSHLQSRRTGPGPGRLVESLTEDEELGRRRRVSVACRCAAECGKGHRSARARVRIAILEQVGPIGNGASRGRGVEVFNRHSVCAGGSLGELVRWTKMLLMEHSSTARRAMQVVSMLPDQLANATALPRSSR